MGSVLVSPRGIKGVGGADGWVASRTGDMDSLLAPPVEDWEKEGRELTDRLLPELRRLLDSTVSEMEQMAEAGGHSAEDFAPMYDRVARLMVGGPSTRARSRARAFGC